MINRISKLIGVATLKKIILEQNNISSEVKIGADTSIKGSVISGRITIGSNCRINHISASGNISIGNNTSVWGPNIYMRSAINNISIGNFCSIARNVTIQEYNHDYKKFTTYFIEQNVLKSGKHNEEIVSKGNIEIGHDVWIGANCVILSGAKIETGAIIAAGSVVSGYIPPYAIATGTPAKVIKFRFEENIRQELLNTEWWNWDDEKLKKNISQLENIVKG
jgi:virginiamycin A acetyltransferase